MRDAVVLAEGGVFGRHPVEGRGGRVAQDALALLVLEDHHDGVAEGRDASAGGRRAGKGEHHEHRREERRLHASPPTARRRHTWTPPIASTRRTPAAIPP